jgi:hypothetical protein
MWQFGGDTMPLPTRYRLAKIAALSLSAVVGLALWTIPVAWNEPATAATISTVLVVPATGEPPGGLAPALAAGAAAAVASRPRARSPEVAHRPEPRARAIRERARQTPRRERGVVFLGLRFRSDGSIEPARR